jgi:hypothetical protein
MMGLRGRWLGVLVSLLIGATWLLAAAGGAPARLPAPRASVAESAFRLFPPRKSECTSPDEIIGNACVTLSGYGNEWTQTDGTAMWTHPTQMPQWITRYRWTVPTTVAAQGAYVALTVNAQEETHDPNASVCPAIGVGATEFMVGAPQAVSACAMNDQNGVGNPATKTKMLRVKLLPPDSAGSITLAIGIQDGPSFLYTYRFAAPPNRTKIRYSFGGTVMQPKTKTNIDALRLTGFGSFLLVFPYTDGFARGDRVEGTAQIEFLNARGHAFPVHLKAIRAKYFPASNAVQVRYRVTASTLRCAPVGRELTMTAEDDVGGDKIFFGICNVSDFTFSRHMQTVTVKAMGVAG